MAVFEVGDKVHVVRRRGFDGDLRRHFLGEIAAAEGRVARIVGYVFLYDTGSSSWVRRDDMRTTVMDLGHPGLIVNLVDKLTDVEAARYEIDEAGRLVITDGDKLRLNVYEFGLHR